MSKVELNSDLKRSGLSGAAAGGTDSAPRANEETSLPKTMSLSSEIVINMSILMVTAILLIVVVLNWIHNYVISEYVQYARFLLIPYILIFALTVAVFGWRLISKLIIKPVRELLNALNRVAAGDLSARVQVKENNEMGQLAGAFNRMTARLADNRLELTAHLVEVTRLNQNLARTQRELLSSEKLASVGRLAAGVAHEIGNPLSAIAGYLDILARRKYLEPQDQELLTRLQSEVERIHGIIRELLDYSRPQDESLDLIELNDSVKSTLILMRGEKGFSLVELELDLGELPPLRANRSSVQQLIMNLCLNAIQAMPEGGHLSIQTRAAVRGGQPGMELVVADTGPGISRENLDHIFDPFFTTKEPGQGTGLGLSICLRIVDNLQGKIEAESRPGSGAAFKIWLPAADDSRPDIPVGP